MTFVFGHTHKPFQDLLVLDGYPNPVQVFNTGGWVLDQVRQATTQGAAAVFIDDELNAGSLRLFQANPADEVMPVHVQHVRGAKTPSEPLSGVKDRHLWTRQLIDAAQSTQGEWASFSAAAYKSLALRSKIISHRFFDPHAHLTARQRRRAQ